MKNPVDVKTLLGQMNAGTSLSVNNAAAESLVFQSGDKSVTTSLAIAEGTDVEHKNVMELIRKYLTDLQEFGEVAFQTRLNKQGSPTEYALLNEHQSTLLLTYMRNSDIGVNLRKG